MTRSEKLMYILRDLDDAIHKYRTKNTDKKYGRMQRLRRMEIEFIRETMDLGGMLPYLEKSEPSPEKSDETTT